MGKDLDIYQVYRINSEAACRFFAAALHELAKQYEDRLDELQNWRLNYRPVDDRYPVIWAANRALEIHKFGGDGATACHTLSIDLLVPHEHVLCLYRRKLRAHEADSRRRRNDLICKWHNCRVGVREIERRLDVSPSLVSSVIRKR